VLKVHDVLINELSELLGLGDDDEDVADDDGDDDDEEEDDDDYGNTGNGDAKAEDVDAADEDDEDSKILIPKQEYPEDIEVLGPEEVPEPPSELMQPSLYMQMNYDESP
jgi:hypothetical protein